MSMLELIMADQAGQVNPLLPSMPAAAAPSTAVSPPSDLTPYQAKMLAMAGSAQQVADNPIFGAMPSGDNPAAYDRQRAMMVALKELSKHGDSVLNELAHVGGVDDPSMIWDEIKGSLHEDIRDRSSEMRHELRRPENHSHHHESPHYDIRGHAKKFADDLRKVAHHEGNKWIHRPKGDEDTYHPDDLKELAKHAHGLHGAMSEFFNHMSNSHHADYRTEELVRGPDGDLVYQPYPNGERRMREHPVHLPSDVHEALAAHAHDVQKEIDEE